MALSMTTADAVLKEFYLAPVVSQLNNEANLVNQLEKNSKDVSGKRAYVPINVYRNSGVGAISDGGTLPDAGEQGYDDELVPLKFNTGRFKVTGPTIRATKDDRGSFVRAVSSEMKGLVRDLKQDVDRQSYNDGTGQIAQFTTTSSGDVLNLAATTTDTQMRQIQRQMKISVGTSGSPTSVSASLLVVSVQRAAKTVTVAAGTGVVTSSSHYLYRKGSGLKELSGLAKIIAASGTLHGISPTDTPEWVSIVDSASADRILTEAKVQNVSDDVEIESGHVPNLWIGSYGVVRAFGNQVSAKQRIVNEVALKAGWTGIELQASGSAFAKGKNCQEGTAWAITTEVIQQYRQADYDFADYDGRTLRNTAGEDGWEGFVVCDHEIATSERNAHAKVTQLTEDNS